MALRAETQREMDGMEQQLELERRKRGEQSDALKVCTCTAIYW